MLVEGKNARYCSKCTELKHFDNFHKQQEGKYGYRASCNACEILRKRKWNIDNKKYQKEYAKKNVDKLNETKKRWAKNNPEKVKKAKQKWVDKNPDYHNEYSKKYTHERYHNDECYRLIINLRNRLYQALNNNVKSKATKELIGCTVKELKQHLEDQFQDGMTWDNQGEWHLDHIIPCAAFDLTNEHAQAVCFHYSNLQPLWDIDNKSKSSSIPDLGIEIGTDFLEDYMELL